MKGDHSVPEQSLFSTWMYNLIYDHLSLCQATGHGNAVSFYPGELVEPRQWQGQRNEGADPCALPENEARLSANSPRCLLHTERTKNPKSSTFPEMQHICDSPPLGSHYPLGMLPKVWSGGRGGGGSINYYLRLSSRVSSSEEKVPLLTLQGE